MDDGPNAGCLFSTCRWPCRRLYLMHCHGRNRDPDLDRFGSPGEEGMDELPKLSHENLDVYHKSIKYLALSTGIAAKLPRKNAELADQLKRAAPRSR